VVRECCRVMYGAGVLQSDVCCRVMCGASVLQSDVWCESVAE